jgi:Mrp family chromosome partitioning ATPase
LRRIFCARRFVLPPAVPAQLAAYKTYAEPSHLANTPEEEALDDYHERLRRISITARNAYRDPDRLLWLIASTRAGEGKTFLTVNLGTVLARDLKKPVLLVDANFRAPSLSKTLGYPNAPGLADILERGASIDDVLMTLAVPGLFLLPTGSPIEDPEMLYNAPTFHSFLEKLRERFSFTLIEAPDMLTSSGGHLLAPHTDGVLFVVLLYKSRRKAVVSAIQRLPAEKMVGVVFNFFEYWIPDWLYRWV